MRTYFLGLMFFRDTKPDPKYYPDLRILRIKISPSTSEFLLGHVFFDTHVGESSSVNQMESYPVRRTASPFASASWTWMLRKL